MSYKTETLAAYDRYAEIFEQKFGFHLDNYIQKSLREFWNILPDSALVLDLGSGPGNHAEMHRNAGLRVVCADISRGMATSCRQKGLPSMIMDFEQLGIRHNSLDGVWAYTSLLHIPKSHFPHVLEQVGMLLRPPGILALAMIAGHSEGFVAQPDKYPGTKRWFSLYQDEELLEILSKNFTVLSRTSTTTPNNVTYLEYLLSVKQMQ